LSEVGSGRWEVGGGMEGGGLSERTGEAAPCRPGGGPGPPVAGLAAGGGAGRRRPSDGVRVCFSKGRRKEKRKKNKGLATRGSHSARSLLLFLSPSKANTLFPVRPHAFSRPPAPLPSPRLRHPTLTLACAGCAAGWWAWITPRVPVRHAKRATHGQQFTSSHEKHSPHTNTHTSSHAFLRLCCRCPGLCRGRCR
jgi:hypothetical protein